MKKVLFYIVFLLLLTMSVGAALAQNGDMTYRQWGTCLPKDEDVIGLIVRNIERFMNGGPCSIFALRSILGDDQTNFQWLREHMCSKSLPDEKRVVFSNMEIEVHGNLAVAEFALRFKKRGEVRSKIREPQESESGSDAKIAIQFTKSPYGYWQVENMRETFSKLHNEIKRQGIKKPEE